MCVAVLAAGTVCGASAAPAGVDVLGVGNAARLPTGKFAVDATRTRWADGSPVESGGLNYPDDIYVVDVRARRVRNVTHDERSEYSWSWLPDGKRILFMSVPSDRMKKGHAHIFIVGGDGRHRRKLTSGAGEVTPELAPTGGRFLYVGQGARHRGLYVMRVDGTHKKQLTHGRERPADVTTPWDSQAHWSPDGKRIVFVRDSDRGGVRSDIFVVAANGGNLRRLTHTRGDSSPLWSPDGRRIAFIREDNWHYLYVMRSDGTAAKRLTLAGYNDSPSIYWLSNQRIAYYNPDLDNPKLRSINVDGTGNRPAAAPRDEALSPDRKWAAFATYGRRSAIPSIWVAHRNGTGRQLVTRKICCTDVGIEWAPK